MSTKLALVVDDSRMARYVLSKMLTEQGITVDSVESGEEALGYLCGKKPNMIFMDHTMPGMDGLQCLRAIKNDPNTGMIPIIMYTSKEGEVYESQARALGAVDILPKKLKPLTLAKVLERQNLLPSQEEELEEALPSAVGMAANDVVIVENNAPMSTVFDDYRKEHKAKTPAPAPVAAVPAPQDSKELDELEDRIKYLTEQLEGLNKESEHNRSNLFLFGGIGLCVLLIGWLLFHVQQLSQEKTHLETQNKTQQGDLMNQAQQISGLQKVIDSDSQVKANKETQFNDRFFKSIEWALNQDGQFDWNEKPFNDNLALTLAQLVENLENVNFVGEINIRSHLGRFCTSVDSTTGQPTLPEAGVLLDSCDITELSPTLIDTLGTEQTEGFERFMTAFDAQYGEKIKITLSTAGDSRPIARYPLEDISVEAEQWNNAAARNQRIEIAITPL